MMEVLSDSLMMFPSLSTKRVPVSGLWAQALGKTQVESVFGRYPSPRDQAEEQGTVATGRMNFEKLNKSI